MKNTASNFSLSETLRELEEEMMHAAGNLEYEKAALLRDQIGELKAGTGLSKIEPKKRPVTYGKPKRNAGSKARA